MLDSNEDLKADSIGEIPVVKAREITLRELTVTTVTRLTFTDIHRTCRQRDLRTFLTTVTNSGGGRFHCLLRRRCHRSGPNFSGFLYRASGNKFARAGRYHRACFTFQMETQPAVIETSEHSSPPSHRVDLHDCDAPLPFKFSCRLKPGEM